jgi:two-component sensor histidine kinase
MASVSKIAQTRESHADYRAEMDRDVANSLEMISNLIYLIRHSLYDPAKTLSYVELAEERLKALAGRNEQAVDQSARAPLACGRQVNWLARCACTLLTAAV